jgi:hypothetical protein
MKVFSNVCTFDYSWEEVSTANWRKYCPWNDKSTHVIAVDTLSRHVDPETGIVRSLSISPGCIKTNFGIASNRATHYVQTNCSEMAILVDGW